MELHVAAAAAAAHAPRVAGMERNLRGEEPFLRGENSEVIAICCVAANFEGLKGFGGCVWGNSVWSSAPAAFLCYGWGEECED